MRMAKRVEIILSLRLHARASSKFNYWPLRQQRSAGNQRQSIMGVKMLYRRQLPTC